MADTPQAAARRCEYYLQMMRKARQLNDQILIRLILKKLARLGRTGARSTAGGCMVFPFPAIQAPAQTLDQGPHIPDFLTSNDSKGGDKMDKKLLAYYCIVVLIIGGLAAFLSLDSNPEDFNYKFGMIKPQSTQVVTSVDHGPRSAPGISLINTICVIMLVGYLVWVFYRKVQKNSQTDSIAMEDYLYKISRLTGHNEYDLFCKSAEDWTVSAYRIDQDFKRYIIDQSLPYYVKDFVRKNHEDIDESLIKKEEVKPTSWWDWAKALLVFPGSFLFLVFIAALFGSSSFWLE
jgi:hypothetical protein